MALPQTVGVCGGGWMGAGIAHAFLVAGAAVVIMETDDAAAAAAPRPGFRVAARWRIRLLRTVEAVEGNCCKRLRELGGCVTAVGAEPLDEGV